MCIPHSTAWRRFRTVPAPRRSRNLPGLWLLWLLWLLPAAVLAQEYTYTTNGGTITITGYTGPGGAVTIPSMITGRPVTRIGYGAFYYCFSLTSVTIPNSVTNIGDSAFSDCTSLTNVTIPSSVTGIGYSAFSDCTSLASIMIPGSVTSIGNWTFSDCTSLASVTIPNSVTSIKWMAFSGCTSLTRVTIPDSVTNIGDMVFYSCTSLTSVTIGNSVISIADYAFSSCTNLTAVSFHGNAPSVGSYVFSLADNVIVYCLPGTTGWGPTFADRPTAPWYPPVPCSYTTNNGTVTVTRYLGSGGSATLPVTIHGLPVTSIGDRAFSSCPSLFGVYFQSNAPGFGSDVFSSTDHATVYYLPGTTGWGPTFGGRPTVLWNPQVQTSGGNFGVRTNRFGFTITGASNLVIVVEACVDPINPLWTRVGTNILTGGSSYFNDPQWTNYFMRCYRLRSP